MKDIMLSIHPKHAEAILRGEKKLELRKSAPTKAADEDSWIYLYATSPIKQVIGRVRLRSWRLWDIPLFLLWHEFSDVLKATLTYEDIESYYHNTPDSKRVVWGLDTPQRAKTPQPITDFGLKRAPQSWCYVGRKEERRKL